MYIYNGQTCPAGWIFHDISAAVINESTIPVDACIKYWSKKLIYSLIEIVFKRAFYFLRDGIL
jgi:hypothetical protein